MSLLVETAWLAAHLTDVVVADVRWSPTGGTAEAAAAFEAGHIPGAAFFDVDRDLAGDPTAGPGRHPLPSPEAFARSLSIAGIDRESFVVAYDDVKGSLAARLWWMLDVLGRRVALLDGGLGAWRGALETGVAHGRSPTPIEPRPWPLERIGDADDVAAAIHDETTVVLDARTPERYRGEVEPIDPVAGHIPGARNAPWVSNLDASGRFVSAEQLRERYAELGVTDGAGAIAHCGSGVTACHDLLAMRLAGLHGGRLYVGSWSGWVSDPARPIATGEEPAAVA
jgi:thiosulfate/3-mercaptopyruvate sulfurtransferase